MNKAIVLLIITTLAASLACLHLVRTLRQERAQNAALEAELAAQKAQLSAPSTFVSSSQPAEAPPSIDRNPATTFQRPARNESDQTVVPDSRTPPDAGVQSERERLQNPAYRDALRARLRGNLPALYPGLTVALSLSQEESDRLFDLLADQQIQEIEHPIFAEWEEMNPPAYQEAQRRLQERQQQQQTDLELHLGPAMYDKWNAYRQTLEERHRVVSLQSSLALAGTPMSADQTEAALEALIAQDGRQQNDPLALQDSPTPDASMGSEQWLVQLENEHERMLTAVKPVLTSEQYAQFERQLANELAMSRASAQLQQSQMATQR